ncbi:MAG: hypothetical protein IPL62_18410 [Caulobacteraceae bacterium]|nr:hypothetical protein [Caulobacteraceae bacterium]
MKASFIALLATLTLAIPVAASAQQQAPPAPSSMRRQALEAEVERSRAIIQGGAVLPQRPAGCTSAESRQFDFGWANGTCRRDSRLS